jgi:hypothetical protein
MELQTLFREGAAGSCSIRIYYHLIYSSERLMASPLFRIHDSNCGGLEDRFKKIVSLKMAAYKVQNFFSPKKSLRFWWKRISGHILGLSE